MRYEQLLDEAVDLGLTVKEKPLQSADGRTYRNRIAVRQDMTTARKTCVLAEEIGHCLTTVGNILSQNSIGALQQEHRARVWAFKKLLPAEEIVRAAEAGYTQVYEMAEFLDVDEEFLRDCLIYYGIVDISL